MAREDAARAGAVDVTVIVPCCNNAAYVAQCLETVCQNDRVRLEVLAINDGSSDDSLAVLNAAAEKDVRIRVIDKPNQGYGATVNRGIAEARGAYVAVAEADDYVLPHMYDALFELAQVYGEPDVVKSSYWRIVGAETAAPKRYHGYIHGRVRVAHQPFAIDEAPQLLEFHPSIWSGLYRRAFLEDRGIRLIEAPGGGWVDNPFLVETLCQAKGIVFTDDAYYCYREDIAGTSTALRNAKLSYDRWNDRQDVLDRLRVTDAGVLRANYVVGFKFIGAAVGEGALDDADLRAQTAAIFGRMDPAIVAGMTDVSPSLKVLYHQMTGSDAGAANANRLGYALHLVGETAWGLRHNGLGFVASNIALARSRAKDSAN